jgi:dipeptidyl aminopeptidase/acylaminoacyl peptidase
VAQSLKTGKRAIVVPRGSMPSFSGGYLFYMTGRSLQAQRFDPDRLEVNGPVMTVVADVARVGSGGAWFAISGNGTLAALREDVPGASRLIWLDRHGATSVLNLPPATYNNFRLSPDASRVAVTVSAPDSDIWTFDVTHGTSTRITNDGKSLWPIWSADGSRILYTSTRGGPALLRSRRSNGSGDDDPVISTSLISRGNEWSASGLLTYMLVDTSADLWTTMPGGTPTVYAASDGDDGNARISPDGKWLAFRSTRTGRPAIYVDRFPAPTGEPIQVPGDGGSGPVWSHDGRELFFINGNRIWGATRQPAGTFSETRTIVDVPLPLADVEFDLAPDGRFLLAVRDRAAPRRSELLLTLNADADLRRRAPK